MDWDNVSFDIEFNVPEDPEGSVVGIGIVDTPRSVLAVAYMFARVGIAIANMNTSDEETPTSVWPMNVALNCGSELEIKGPEDFPLESVRCPCGNPKHYFVKWYDEA